MKEKSIFKTISKYQNIVIARHIGPDPDAVASQMALKDAIKLTCDAFDFIASFEGEVPGVSAVECGNYRDHSLEGAKKEAQMFLPVIKNVTVESLKY